MGVYIQTKDGLKKVSVDSGSNDNQNPSTAEVTAESIKTALGYTPANADRVANIEDDESGEYYIVDADGNIIFKIDADGLHTTAIEAQSLTLNGEAVVPGGTNSGDGGTSEGGTVEIPQELLDHVDDTNNPHGVTAEQVGLGNVNNTSDADKPVSTQQQAALNALRNALSEQIVSQAEEFHIVDDQGNIVATIDANGLHTTKVEANSIVLNGTELSAGGDVTKEYVDDSATASSGTVGLSYTLDGSTYKCSHKGTAGLNIVIPATYKGLPVTKISDAAFSNTYIESIELSHNITEVCYQAFQSCTSLSRVVFNRGLTKIGQYAFTNCTSLTEVIIPKGVTFIGKYAFNQCTSLKRVFIPSGVSNIEMYAFRECPNLTIYCESTSKPTGWSDDWNTSNCTVIWGEKPETLSKPLEIVNLGDFTFSHSSGNYIATISDSALGSSNVLCIAGTLQVQIGDSTRNFYFTYFPASSTVTPSAFFTNTYNSSSSLGLFSYTLKLVYGGSIMLYVTGASAYTLSSGSLTSASVTVKSVSDLIVTYAK